MVKNLPSNVGDVGSMPGQGTKVPRAVCSLSLLAQMPQLEDLGLNS